jgi:hypothetical protein
MGPPLDQLSFLLLCLGFGRNQMLNLGLNPYSGWLCSLRSIRLRRAFPQYNSRILHDYAVNYAYAQSSNFVPMSADAAARGGPPLVRPTLEAARELPRAYENMSHDALSFFSAFDNIEAIRELLVREV